MDVEFTSEEREAFWDRFFCAILASFLKHVAGMSAFSAQNFLLN